MYTRILAPLDGSKVSERILPYAQALAAGLSLPVTLLFAVEPEHPSISQSLNQIRHQEETESHRSGQARRYLDAAAARLRNTGLSVDTATPHGEPSATIVDEAAKDPGMLITMASHGRSGLARWWLGSVTDKVLHLTGNPLLIIRSGAEPQAAPEGALERITVPVDGSDLAEQILPHVAYISAAMGLAVDLVQVTPSESEYYRSMSVAPGVLPPTLPSYQSFADIVDYEAWNYLADVKGRLEQQGAHSVTEHVLHGTAADSIADLAIATANNLVAMTTHGRSGVGRLVLGSVAERVVRQSGDPVLLVRATGL